MKRQLLAATKKAKRQRTKTQRKFSKSAKRGKLSKYAKDRIEQVKQARQIKSRGRFDKIRNDWLSDREMRQNDTDSDYSNNEEEEEYKIFNNKHQKKEEEDNDEMDLDEIKEHLLTFGGFDEEKEMLLPIKIGRKLINRIKMDVEKEEEEEVNEEEENMEEKEQKINEDITMPDLTNLNDQQLGELYTKLIKEAEVQIALNAEQIITDPNENISKFRNLLKMAAGEGQSTLIREAVQKLATATLAQAFVNVLPGYKIHTLTEVEKGQKMKKETKRLASFEQLLLSYYVKYLKFCEKTANKLFSTKIDENSDELPFSSQFGILCGKCLCLLAEKCSHFNYASNILSCLARLSLCKCKNLLNSICCTFSTIFAEDCTLQISLNGVKTISKLVEKKKAYVPAQLISTLLSLNIKEVDRDGNEVKRLKKEKLKKKELINKKRRKINKQVGKLENELIEAISANKYSSKLQISTQIIHTIFLIYFKILKRMPQTELLCPVLQGLSKFVHLINIDFYDDLMQHLGRLVEQKQLKVTETLNCIHTASTIFTVESQAIDVDLQKFYKALYNVMPKICFQPEQEIPTQILLLIESIQLLLIKRKKHCSTKRVASFIKRLALISVAINFINMNDERCTAALLLILRRIFLNFPSLNSMIFTDKNEEKEDDDEEEEDNLIIINNCFGGGHQFNLDSCDPDNNNILGKGIFIKEEIKMILKNNQNNNLIKMLALNLLNGLKLTGKYKLDAKWTSIEPSELFTTLKNDDDKNFKFNENKIKNGRNEFFEKIEHFIKKNQKTKKNKNSTLKQQQNFGSSNFCSIIWSFIKNNNKNC